MYRKRQTHKSRKINRNMRERHPTTNYPGSCPRIGLWQATIRDELRDTSTTPSSGGRVGGEGGEGGRTAAPLALGR